MAGAITMMLAYGHTVDSHDDPFIKIAEKGVATIRAAGAVGAHIVDLVPWRQSTLRVLKLLANSEVQYDIYRIGYLEQDLSVYLLEREQIFRDSYICLSIKLRKKWYVDLFVSSFVSKKYS